MLPVPLYISAGFILTTILAVFIFLMAIRHHGRALAIIGAWLTLQAGLALSGFYLPTAGLPPRFALSLLPPALFIVMLLVSRAGKSYLDGANLRLLTLLHVVRIPLELVLWALYLHGAVPKLMTFEGGNLDILSGISAIVMYYVGFVGGHVRRRLLLIGWNIVCLALLGNIVARAILSAPFSFQQFGMEQPNIALLHFPFIWLPACVVPLVLLAHLTALRQLLKMGIK